MSGKKGAHPLPLALNIRMLGPHDRRRLIYYRALGITAARMDTPDALDVAPGRKLLDLPYRATLASLRSASHTCDCSRSGTSEGTARLVTLHHPLLIRIDSSSHDDSGAEE